MSATHEEPHGASGGAPLSPVREFLYGLERFGIKLGLENIRRMLHAMGNPHLRLNAVHVAGTNGKGSVLAFLDAMLRAAGYSTGRYTSPHLIRLNERFLLDSVPCGDEELDAVLEEVRQVAEPMDPPPTFFEFVTAAGFALFDRRPLDLALIEVGMGGRFDSTNVVEPLFTAVTNIDLEHTQHLGDTLEKIAYEKAGILKQGVPAVVAEVRSGPGDVILNRASEVGAPVRLLGRDFQYSLEGAPFAHRFSYEGKRLCFGPVPLGLAGDYQGENAATAVALAEWMMETHPLINTASVVQGLEDARWPCRLERVMDSPPVIIDVAHNHAGALKLAKQLPPCVLVMAVAADKAAREMVQTLQPIARELILTEFSGHRALPVDLLVQAAEGISHRRVDGLPEAIALGLELASEDLPLVITGSIFTAGEARRLLVEQHGASAPEF